MNPISGILGGVENILQDVEKVLQEVSQFSNLLDQAGGANSGQAGGANSGQSGVDIGGILKDVAQALPLLAAL